MADTSVVSVLDVDCDGDTDVSQLNPCIVNVNGEDSDTSYQKPKPLCRKQRIVDPVIKCQVDLGSGNTKCCVLNCPSNSLTRSNKNKSQITFVTFPRDPSRFTEWIRAIGRQDLLSFMGKKEATDLLICSKHFPENMWVNQNTRLKRLHKNAVPEINLDDDDDDDIIQIIPNAGKEKAEEKTSYSKKGGIKVKKVSTLLTESALRDSKSLSVDSSIPFLSSTEKSSEKITGKKWPTILIRKPPMTNTDLERKLLSENGQLKSELDKNMDYILNQKAHYEGILAKEKDKVQDLTGKIGLLQSAQRKLWATFEAKLHAEKSTVTTKNTSDKETTEKLKALQQSNIDLESRLMTAQATIHNLKQANDDLQELVTRKHKNEPLPNNQFQGENFKLFLHNYLRKKEKMDKKIESLILELEEKNESGQKSSILNSAAKHLNHCQLAWLESLLHQNDFEGNKWPEHFKELCIFLYESSETAYKTFMKAFGLAPVHLVQKWIEEPHSNITSRNSTINALFEEGQPMLDTLQKRTCLKTNIIFEKNISDLVEVNKKIKIKTKSERERSSAKKRKFNEILENDGQYDEEYEEGKITDEDEELFFSDDSDKEEEEDEEEEDEEEEDENDAENSESVNNKEEEPYQQKRTIVDIPNAGPSTQNQQTDFDFMLEENSESTPMHLGSSMPMLVPDSPMTPLTNLNHNSDIMKVSSRKRVIASDSSLQTSSGSKVIFRVIES